MDKTIRENIILKISNNLLFIEIVNLLKNNQNIILDSIINNKFYNIIIILKKINYDIKNIKNLSDDDLILINELIKDKTNILTILLEMKEKRKEINDYVNRIFNIQRLLTLVITLIYVYMIYDLYIVNNKKTNIDMYLYNLSILDNIFLFTYFICFQNSIIAIGNNYYKFPLLIYIIIFKTILIFILSKHEIIIKLTNNYGHILIISIIILIIASLLYILNDSETYKPITDIDLSVYIYDKYGQHLDFDQYLINDEIK